MIVTPILKPIKTPQFGKQQLLTRLFREGKLPTVIKDIYGITLEPGKVSIEHLLPKSKGGSNALFNKALADVTMNNYRGSRPLRIFVTKDREATIAFATIEIKIFNFLFPKPPEILCLLKNFFVHFISGYGRIAMFSEF